MCLEHVDNLGAYSIPSETGLLIPSDFISYPCISGPSFMRFERLPFSPRLIQARWVLYELPSEDLPRLAQDALESGYDGKNIRRMAGLMQPNRADLLPLMPGFLAEMGVAATLSSDEAGRLLARLVAQGISEGQITPYEGARFIWKIFNALWPNQQHRLLSFVGHASEYEDCESYSQHPEKTRLQIEQDIIEDARALLADRNNWR